MKQGGMFFNFLFGVMYVVSNAHTTIEEASEVETTGIVCRNRMAKGLAKVSALGAISHPESKQTNVSQSVVAHHISRLSTTRWLRL